MNRTSPRLRSLFAVGSLAAVVGSVACGSSPDAGETAASGDQALLSPVMLPACPSEYARVCNPGTINVCPCQPEIQTAALPPDANGDRRCSLDGPIPVPPELEGLGCTLGTLFDGSSRVWACPVGTPKPPSIAWPQAIYGSVISIDDDATWEGNICLGGPIPSVMLPGRYVRGWEYIVQSELSIFGCSSGCPPEKGGGSGSGSGSGSGGSGSSGGIQKAAKWGGDRAD